MMPRPNWVIPSISNNWIRYLELVLLLGLLPGDFYLQCQCYQQSANLQVTSNPTVFTNSAVSLPFTPVPWHNYTTIYGTDGIIGSENFYTEHPTQMNLSNRRSLRLSFPFGRYRNRAPRRRKPQFGYTHPYRRPHRLRRIIAPSKLQSWQKELRNRFNNHRRHVEKLESERKSLAQERGFKDTFMSSAMMPLSVMMFSMLFMDILGRLMPWSPLGKTTTTPRPKITRVEYNPPKIPSIGDLLGEVKTQLQSINDLKGIKRRKKYGWSHSSSEEQWDDNRPSRRSKYRKKNASRLRKRKNKPQKKKKKYNSEPLTLSRLHELMVKNRPSFF